MPVTLLQPLFVQPAQVLARLALHNEPLIYVGLLRRHNVARDPDRRSKIGRTGVWSRGVS